MPTTQRSRLAGDLEANPLLWSILDKMEEDQVNAAVGAASRGGEDEAAKHALVKVGAIRSLRKRILDEVQKENAQPAKKKVVV